MPNSITSNRPPTPAAPPEGETLDARLIRCRIEPEVYIVTEIPHKSGVPRVIHEIHLPPSLDPKNYQPGISISAFQNGRRKGASKLDKKHHRDRCCWGPNALYHVKTLEQWRMDTEMEISGMRKAGIGPKDWPDPREQHRTFHASVYEFYQAIGFDRKSRCYRDGSDNEIKYSLIKTPPEKTT